MERERLYNFLSSEILCFLGSDKVRTTDKIVQEAMADFQALLYVENHQLFAQRIIIGEVFMWIVADSDGDDASQTCGSGRSLSEALKNFEIALKNPYHEVMWPDNQLGPAQTQSEVAEKDGEFEPSEALVKMKKKYGEDVDLVRCGCTERYNNPDDPDEPPEDCDPDPNCQICYGEGLRVWGW